MKDKWIKQQQKPALGKLEMCMAAIHSDLGWQLKKHVCQGETNLLVAFKCSLCFLTVLLLGKVTDTLKLNLSTALSCARVLLTIWKERLLCSRCLIPQILRLCLRQSHDFTVRQSISETVKELLLNNRHVILFFWVDCFLSFDAFLSPACLF